MGCLCVFVCVGHCCSVMIISVWSCSGSQLTLIRNLVSLTWKIDAVLSVCSLSLCLSVSLSVCLSVCLFHVYTKALAYAYKYAVVCADTYACRWVNNDGFWLAKMWNSRCCVRKYDDDCRTVWGFCWSLASVLSHSFYHICMHSIISQFSCLIATKHWHFW